MTLRSLVFAVLFSSSAFAQVDSTQPKVIVVPVPAEAADGGVGMTEPQPVNTTVPVPQEPQPEPVYQPPPPDPAPPPISEPAAPPQDPIDPSLLPPPPPVNQGATAMLDGHPREGAFLAGPGSLAFILHHTLWGTAGALATQIAPRIQDLALIDTVRLLDERIDPNGGYRFCATPESGEICSAADADDRTAYLTAGLIGLGVGFASSAIWQFTHWLDRPAVLGGFLHGLFGGLFFAGFSGLLTADATAIAWLSFLGSEAAMWASIILGGGELPANKVLFISTGAFWATAFVGLLMGIIATSGGGLDVRTGLSTVMLAPGIGALATGLFSLRYSPSIAKVMRANLFGVLAASAVFLVSGLVLGANFVHPVPYVLAPIAAGGTMTLVSLLWADAAESPVMPGDGAAKARDPMWWW
jgi:hypothetical protein